MRIADFKSALKIAPAKTNGNFIVKRAAFFYWLIGIVIAAVAIAIAFHFDGAVRDFMARHNPAALAETESRFREAIERGLWRPRRNSLRTKVMADG